MSSMSRAVSWINAIDLVVQALSTLAYLFALRMFQDTLTDGAAKMNDRLFSAQLATTFASPAWTWIHVIPFLLLLTVVVHKILWRLLEQQMNKFDAVVFVFDSVCMTATFAWLLHWLFSQDLTQAATFIDSVQGSRASDALLVWRGSVVAMLVSFQLVVLAEFIYVYRTWAALRVQPIGGEFEALNTPLLEEPDQNAPPAGVV
ncbi:Uncharacterized protein PBTT_08655 [Plasmodiophora brassicae]